MERSAERIRYARTASDEVAWTESGAGAPLLIGGWWMSHLERDAEYEPIRRFVGAIGRHRRVIRMDPLGSGLSRSRRETPIELGPHVETLSAVIDAAGVAQVTLLAGSSGCPIAVAFAAQYPDRVHRLILCGSYLDGPSIASDADRAALVDLVRRSWGISSRVMSEIFYPDATPEQQNAFLRHQRSTGSAETAAAALAAVYSFDAREFAAAVRAPTLVLHRRGDRAIRLALGVETAQSIPGAKLEVLEGTAHHPWHGDSGAVLRSALSFDGVGREALATTLADHAGEGESTAGGGIIGPISPREREILVLVAQGKTDSQIATELFLSIHTVHRHVANARSKLGVTSRAAAAAWVASHPA